MERVTEVFVIALLVPIGLYSATACIWLERTHYTGQYLMNRTEELRQLTFQYTKQYQRIEELTANALCEEADGHTVNAARTS